jgi:hypothetical protein
MPKYIVRVGGNAPDPAGKRDIHGRPVEVRFEVGDELSDQSVSPKDLATLLKAGAIEPIQIDFPASAGADLDPAPPVDGKAKK